MFLLYVIYTVISSYSLFFDLFSTYEERRAETDAVKIKAQYQEALDTITMLRSNMEYAVSGFSISSLTKHQAL